MATHRILSLLAATSCMLGCAGTRLMVQVEPPKAGFHALLLPINERCALGGHNVTDQGGNILLTEEYCGKLQLVVSARGYVAERRVIDTCDTKLVRVVMRAAAPVSYPEDACSVAALHALRVWLGKDLDALRGLLVDPNDVELYRRHSSDPEPWQFTLAGARSQDAACIAEARLFYEAGCEELLRVDMQRADDGSYRLRGLRRDEP